MSWRRNVQGTERASVSELSSLDSPGIKTRLLPLRMTKIQELKYLRNREGSSSLVDDNNNEVSIVDISCQNLEIFREVGKERSKGKR